MKGSWQKVKNLWPLLPILVLAFFLRFYRLSELMPFGGDVARDYLAARDITLKGIFPLLGSPSSVPWLHQGALFTYLLGIVLWIGKYNPLSGGYFVGAMGGLAVLAVYFLTAKFLSKKAGFVAALVYASSPLVVIFDRYPYHQSLISLFTVLFFLCLYYSWKKPIFFILSSFVLGLLLQLELSNLILAPILIIPFLDFRKKISLKFLLLSAAAFLVTWLPKIIYDISFGFTQTLGFLAWILHKFFPFGLLAAGEVSATVPLTNRIFLIFDYLAKIFFWPTLFGVLILFVGATAFLVKDVNFKKRREIKFAPFYLIFLWIAIPFLGMLFGGSPSVSYMSVFFALPAILSGYLSEKIRGIFLPVLIFFIALAIFNTHWLIKNDYFMLTEKFLFSETGFNFGQSYKINREMAEFIVNDAAGGRYNIIPLGKFAEFPSAKLNLVYLNWYLGNIPNEKDEKIKYFVFYNTERKEIVGISKEKVFPYLTIQRAQRVKR